MSDQYAKHRRYRQRLIGAGLCPHCGKDPFPYRECQERRLYKRVLSALRRLVGWGLVRHTARGYVLGDPNAKAPRGPYRLKHPEGQPPRGFERFVQELLTASGRPMPDTEIEAAWRKHRSMPTARP